jgi:hypothetical protein
MSERRPAVAWVAIDHDGEPLAATVEPKAAQHWSHGTLRVARCVEITDAERDLLLRLGPSVDAPAGRIVQISVEERKTVHGLLARLGGAT